MSRKAIMYIVIVLAVLAGLYFWFEGCNQTADLDERLLDWGLPGDLRRHVGDIETLQLSGGVHHLTWLPRRGKLENLKLVAVSNVALTSLPEGLRTLEVERSSVSSLSRLPRSIRRLSLLNTGVSDLGSLPQQLQHLHVKGQGLSSLDGLPSGLQSLVLEETGVALTDAALPAGLQALSVTDAGAVTLHSLGWLETLTLYDTEVASLSRLSERLRFLALRKNENLAFDDPLPQLLQEVRFDSQGRIPASILPRNLKALTLINTSVDDPSQLPPRVERLELRLSNRLAAILGACPRVTDLTVDNLVRIDGPLPDNITQLVIQAPAADLVLPADLVELKVINASNLALPGVSSQLRRLELETPGIELTAGVIAALLDRFPALESLALAGAGEKLTGLPDLSTARRLTALDLSNTGLERIDSLPPNLLTLTIADSRIAALPPLPATLTRLDVSNSQVTGIEAGDPLPDLVSLTVHTGQLRRIGDRFPGLTTFAVVAHEKEKGKDEPQS